MDAEVSSTVEMAVPGAPEGPEVEGNLALARIETDPWVVPVPVPLGGPKEEEEVHWAILDGFGSLPRRSLKTALRILTEDLPSVVEVSPSLAVHLSFESPWEALKLALSISGAQGEVSG
jgi:hypothetical protein